MENGSAYCAIEHQYIPLPEGIMPWTPTFSPDGAFILFHDYNGGKEWMVGADGSGLKCVTGGMEGRPGFLGGFYYLLDDRRMFLSNELGDTAVILECEPSVYDWKSYRFLSIDLSGDAGLGRPCLGRRTYHMAPDGRHLAYNYLCPEGLVMLLCTLERREDRYEAADYRVLNPEGPRNGNDPDPAHWANGGALCEFKAFCDGGRGMLFVTEGEGGNIDQYHRDLATGKITRLTYDADWDEDGAISPGGQYRICGSWRGMNQLDVLSRVPGSLPLLNLYVSAAAAVYYVSSFSGFSNDLQPWLLPGGGGNPAQPLSPYHGGDVIAVNNIAGSPMWHPDGTRVLLQERMLTPPPGNANERVLEKGMAPNRLHIACLPGKPAACPPIEESEPGPWAAGLPGYRASADFAGQHELRGVAGGCVRLTIDGNLLRCDHRVRYEHFSNDGVHVLDGEEHVSGNTADLTWTQRFAVTDETGTPLGGTDIALRFRAKAPAPPRNIPPMTVTGRASSTWGGATRRGLPAFGPCPGRLPRPAPLLISVQAEDQLEVFVSADICGKIRPVWGAKVTLGELVQCSGEDGMARFPVPKPSATGWVIKADAGENFTPAEAYFYI